MTFRARTWLKLAALVMLILPAAARAAEALRTPDLLMAKQLEYMAVQSLNTHGGTTIAPHQLARARILMDLALELNNKDAELWRLRRGLARESGDVEAELKALRNYCELRPEDEPANLELILALVQEGNDQTVDARIEAVERRLKGPDGAKLSAPLRSRLASYIAKGAHEIGDRERLSKYLRMATRLDSANLEAVQLTYVVLKEHGASPSQLGVALIGLVRAEPFKATSREQLAVLLLSQGAYEAAAKQYEAAMTLPRQSSNLKVSLNFVLSLAASGDSDQALKVLRQLEFVLSRASSQATEPVDGLAGEADAPAAAPLIDPELARTLWINIQRFRLAIYASLNRRQDSAVAFAGLRDELQRLIDEGEEQASVDLAWYSVLFGQVDDQTRQLVSELAEKRGKDDDLVRRLKGFLLIHEGQIEQARSALAPLAERDPLAQYGHALTLEKDQRVAALQEMMQREPDRLVNLLARRELKVLGASPKPTHAGRALAKMIGRWPRSFVVPSLGEDQYTSLQVKVVPQSARHLVPIFAEVSIRNISGWRLSMGAGGTIPTAVLVFPKPRAGHKEVSVPPIVADFGRLLGLDSRQTLTLPVPLERSGLGLFLSSVPNGVVTIGTRVLYDPRAGPRGQIGTGPLGGTATGNIVELRELPPSIEVVRGWVDALSSSDRVQQFLALARLSQVLPLMVQNQDFKQNADQAIDAINALFPKLDTLGQAWITRFVPTGEASEDLFSTIHTGAQRSDDPLTQIIYLTVHTPDPASTPINAALRHPDPQIADYARALVLALQPPPEAQPAP